jgi:hypothetical protein
MNKRKLKLIKILDELENRSIKILGMTVIIHTTLLILVLSIIFIKKHI